MFAFLVKKIQFCKYVLCLLPPSWKSESEAKWGTLACRGWGDMTIWEHKSFFDSNSSKIILTKTNYNEIFMVSEMDEIELFPFRNNGRKPRKGEMVVSDIHMQNFRFISPFLVIRSFNSELICHMLNK